MNQGAALDNRVMDYFIDRHEFLSSLPTYKDAYGQSSHLKYDVSGYSHSSPEDPIIDNTPEAKLETENSLKKMASRLYGASEDSIIITGRSLMLSGGTVPIKVEAVLYRALPKTFYVKQFDLHRVLGMESYNLLRGNKPLSFIFSDHVIIEEEAPGRLASSFSNLEMNKDYLKNLVRLEVLADILSIHDLGNPFNLNVDTDYNIHLFDFDKSFSKRGYRLTYGLEARDDFPIDQIIIDESSLIFSRALKEQDRISTIINIMKLIDFQSKEAAFLGFRNMGEYFESKIKNLMLTRH